MPVSTVVDARPVALVDGRSVFWSELKPILSELAGGEALQELILDRLLDRELEQRGVSVTADDISRERMLLVRSLHQDVDVAARLLDELRRRRRLGPIRFQKLLYRNAALRALVEDDVQISAATLQRTFDILYGERRQARLITTASLADAREALRRIEEGEPFSDVAVEVSTDPSASRGGLLSPLSDADPGYPAALRQAIWRLEPDECSQPILIDDQYALVQLVRIVEPQDVYFDDVRDEVERVSRLNQERLLMERHARRLLGSVSLTFFDDSIEESYRALRRAGSSPVEP